LLALTVSVGAVQQQQPFQSVVDLVRLPVVVLDHAGSPVHRLAPNDFEILENGRRQVVTSFTEGGDLTPLHLGLMLDKSSSMEQDLKAAANGAVKFVTMLTEASDVTFVDFDRGVRLGRFTPDNYTYLFERIRDQKVGSGTVLYDALGRYIAATRDREGLHLLVVYSDGGDSMSRTSLGELVSVLRQGNVIVYSIGYLDNQSGSGRVRQQSVLSRIARETGGEAFFPASDGDLDRTYARILGEVQARYTLGYVSSDRRNDGKFRKVEVRLSRSDLKDATVRTRSGYMAPGTR